MRAVTLLVLSLGLSSTAVAGPTWDKMKAATWAKVSSTNHKEAGSVEIQKVDIDGVECWGGMATAAVQRAKLAAVAADVAAATEWSTAGVTEAELLGKDGGKLYYYQYLDIPGWTMSADRFWFLSGTLVEGSTTTEFHWDRIGENGGKYSTRFNEVKTAHPSAIEPPTNVGGWWFSDSGSSTTIKYYICSDTGGAIPGFVQSAATKQTLPDTIGDVVREAKKRGG